MGWFKEVETRHGGQKLLRDISKLDVVNGVMRLLSKHSVPCAHKHSGSCAFCVFFSLFETLG